METSYYRSESNPETRIIEIHWKENDFDSEAVSQLRRNIRDDLANVIELRFNLEGITMSSSMAFDELKELRDMCNQNECKLTIVRPSDVISAQISISSFSGLNWTVER